MSCLFSQLPFIAIAILFITNPAISKKYFFDFGQVIATPFLQDLNTEVSPITSPASRRYTLTSFDNTIPVPATENNKIYQLRIKIIERGASYIIPSISEDPVGQIFQVEKGIQFNAEDADIWGAQNMEDLLLVEKNFPEAGKLRIIVHEIVGTRFPTTIEIDSKFFLFSSGRKRKLSYLSVQMQRGFNLRIRNMCLLWKHIRSYL